MKSHSINKLLIAPAVLLSCAFVNSYVAHADGIQESSTTNIATVSQVLIVQKKIISVLA